MLEKIVVVVLCIWTIRANEELEHDKIFQHCKMRDDQKKFAVLPGRGWDNLQNKDMGQILNLNFSQCRFSEDNLYLIPDEVGLAPTKMSNVEIFSESFEHFKNYTSSTSQSINVEFSAGYKAFSASGSYSHEHQTVKNDQLSTKSTLARVQLRYKVYESIFEPDSPLDPTFRNRIMDIASILMEGNDNIYPAYLADLIVRDFGTHVIRAIDAGAVLSKVDALEKKYVEKVRSNADGNGFSAAASASFGSVFSVGLKTAYDTRSTKDKLDEYTDSCHRTRIMTHGGSLFQANFTLNQWESTVQDNLVPIDRTGDPIYYVITHRSLPELDRSTVHSINNLIKQAVKRYYETNVIMGCMDLNSPNFNIDANVDIGHCQEPSANFTMGGVYQKCSGELSLCAGGNNTNPLTGKYNCPKQFTAIRLTSGVNKCENRCTGKWWWYRCADLCSHFETFWCRPNAIQTPNRNGFQFGGVLSDYGGKDKSAACPMNYIPLQFTPNAQICVTNDPDPTNPHAIQFGGFYSCKIGNPLAHEYMASTNGTEVYVVTDYNYWPYGCGRGYVAHILTVARGCQINYCTKTNSISFGYLPPLHRPPFISLNYNPNTTKPHLFSTERGHLLEKDSKGTWQLKKMREEKLYILIGSVVAGVVLALLVSGFVFLIQRHVYKKIRSTAIRFNEDKRNANM